MKQFYTKKEVEFIADQLKGVKDKDGDTVFGRVMFETFGHHHHIVLDRNTGTTMVSFNRNYRAEQQEAEVDDH